MQSGPPFNVLFGGSPNRSTCLANTGRLSSRRTRPPKWTTWQLGPNRFPTREQNQDLNARSFTYPAAFTTGNPIRNVYEGPSLFWSQISIANWWRASEKCRFQIRLDGNNFPIKQPKFADPNGAYNLNNLGAFARIGSGTRGSFSDIGTSNSNMLLIGRFEF